MVRLVVGSSGETFAGRDLRAAILVAEDWSATLGNLERRGWPAELVIAALDIESRGGVAGTPEYASALIEELKDLRKDIQAVATRVTFDFLLHLVEIGRKRFHHFPLPRKVLIESTMASRPEISDVTTASSSSLNCSRKSLMN